MGQGCGGCATCLDTVCGGCTKCVDKTCGCFGGGCSAVCSTLCTKPLSFYVLTTILSNAVILLLAILGLAGADCGDDDQSMASLACMLNIFIALVHCVFAIYIQQRLLCGIQPESGKTHTDTVKQAGNICLYDVGFCLYLVFFVCSFGWQFPSFVWTLSCDGAVAGFVAALFLVFYAICTIFYMILWYCGYALCGAFEATRVPSGSARGPRANIVGIMPQPSPA